MKHLRGQQCLFTETRIEIEVSLLLLLDLTVSANTLSSNKYSNNNIFFLSILSNSSWFLHAVFNRGQLFTVKNILFPVFPFILPKIYIIVSKRWYAFKWVSTLCL